MTKQLYSWKLETDRLQIVFLSQYRPCTSAGPCFPSRQEGHPHWDVIKINDIMSHQAQTLQETGALVEWGPGQLSAARLVYCSWQPSGPNAGGHFHGFSSDLGHLWAPSSFSSCGCVVRPASFRVCSGRAKPGGICKKWITSVSLVHVKNKEALLEGTTAASGKRLSVLVLSKGGKAGMEVPDCNPQRAWGRDSQLVPS